MENCIIFKNYKTASFSKNTWELNFQPMPHCNNKKIQKHSGYQENWNNKFVFSS